MREQMVCFNRVHHLFEEGSTIVVGVSGGADSVCLLELLYELREQWGLSLYVLHVHHGIRGGEADRDARFVKELAGHLGLPFCLVRVHVPEEAARLGMTEEEAGRHLRYGALEEYRQKVGGDRIAVAHHRDDQAETVLFHLFRGSGPRGLAGMPARRGAIIRPLLFASRGEIETYLRRRGVGWCQDSTNQETAYARNKIRHQLLPLVEREINAGAGKHVAQAAEKLAAWRSYIEGAGEEAYGRIAVRRGDELRLAVDALAAEADVIQTEVLRRIFTEMIPGAKDVGQIHYQQALWLLTAPSGSHIDLPGGVRAGRQYGELRFFRAGHDVAGGEEIPVRLVCGVPLECVVGRGGVSWRVVFEIKNRGDLSEEIPKKDYTKWFDYDMIKDGLVLRGPRQGDYFVLDPSGRKKRLNRYYIDRKIPREKRAAQLVVADGSHVLWAIPDRISEAYKITDNTERVLVITKERIPS